MAKEIIDLAVNGKYEVWILRLNPYFPTVVLFHLIAQLFRWAHFMVAVNAEERDWNLCQRIFASPVSPISVVVQADVTQDNESAFGLDLLPLTERDDPLKPTVRIACQVDLVFWMQQLTHISVHFSHGVRRPTFRLLQHSNQLFLRFFSRHHFSLLCKLPGIHSPTVFTDRRSGKQQLSHLKLYFLACPFDPFHEGIIMSHNVIECILQGKEQTGLHMIFLCVLRLRDEINVFQSDRP